MLLNEIESLDYIGKNRECFLGVKDEWERALYYKDFEIIGQIGKFQIHTVSTVYYILYGLYDPDKKRYALFSNLNYYKNLKNVLGINQTGADKQYQGMGLPVKFYSWLVQQKRIILMSGDSQSLGGRSIWERLAKVPGIFVFGYDMKKRESFQIDIDDFFNEDIYSGDVEEDIEEIEKERDELSQQLYINDYHPDSPEYRRLSREIDGLRKKIANLHKFVNHVTNYIYLVAIKGRNK